MVATSSRIVAVRKWLVDRVGDLPEFDEALVSYAWDNRVEQPRTRVFTNRATFTHQPASLKSGRTFRNERGAFDVVVLHYGVDGDPLETAEHACELMALVEGVVADNKVPDVDGVNWLVTQGESSLTDLFSDVGYLAEVVLRVEYDARLQ